MWRVRGVYSNSSSHNPQSRQCICIAAGTVCRSLSAIPSCAVAASAALQGPTSEPTMPPTTAGPSLAPTSVLPTIELTSESTALSAVSPGICAGASSTADSDESLAHTLLLFPTARSQSQRACHCLPGACVHQCYRTPTNSTANHLPDTGAFWVSIYNR